MIECESFLGLLPALFDCLIQPGHLNLICRVINSIPPLHEMPLALAVAMIQFATASSARLRELIHEGNEQLRPLLILFWEVILGLIDETVTAPECGLGMVELFAELLVCVRESPADEELLPSLICSAWTGMELFVDPHPLHAMAIDFFTLCDDLITAGLSPSSISSTISAFKKAGPDFLAFLANLPCASSGGVAIAAMNLSDIPDEIILPLCHYVLSLASWDEPTILFLQTLSGSDICLSFLPRLVEVIACILREDPLAGAHIFLNLCQSVRDPRLPANVDDFLELIPINPFDATLCFSGGLLHLLVRAEDSVRIESSLNVVGMQILQVASLVVAQCDFASAAAFLRSVTDFIGYGCPHGIPLAFYNELINQIFLAFEPALIASGDGSSDFQTAITHFLTMAFESNMVSDVSSIASWFEAVIGREMADAADLSLIRFLPVMEMPLTLAALRRFTMSDDLSLNRAMCSVMNHIAVCGQFWDVFDFTVIVHFLASGLLELQMSSLNILFSAAQSDSLPFDNDWLSPLLFICGNMPPKVQQKMAQLFELLLEYQTRGADFRDSLSTVINPPVPA
jgi:hypothetical protein